MRVKIGLKLIKMEWKWWFSSGCGGLDAESGRPKLEQIVRFATERFLGDPKGFVRVGFLSPSIWCIGFFGW